MLFKDVIGQEEAKQRLIAEVKAVSYTQLTLPTTSRV